MRTGGGAPAETGVVGVVDVAEDGPASMFVGDERMDAAANGLINGFVGCGVLGAFNESS